MSKNERKETEYSPVYYPKNINEDILISEELVELVSEEEKIQGTCQIKMLCQPRASIKLFAEVKANALSYLLTDRLDKYKELYLPNRELNVPGFSVGCHSSPDSNDMQQSIITWTLSKEPVIALGNENTSIAYVIFHIFNFKNFSGTRSSVVKTENGGSCGIWHLDLYWKDWEIEMKSMPTTSETIKDLKASGGCGVTHVGRLRRKDLTSFKPKDAENLLMGLRFVLSFARGFWCPAVLPVGFDNKNNKLWEMWMSPKAMFNAPQTCFDENHPEILEVLFPAFMDKFVDENWNDTIKEAIYWYLKACNSYNGIDSGIILIQAAIERLAYEYAVNQKKLLTLKGFKDLWASDKFRLLFSSIDIPIEIHDSLKDTKQAAKKFNWIDAPHAFTEVRNSLIHPEHKKRDDVKDLYYETWTMGLWYLELAILRLCDYDGNYSNRLTSKWVGEVEKVPWTKK